MELRRLLVAFVLGLASSVFVVGVALADGGPHGSYGTLTTGAAGITDSCAGCHRAHTAVSAGGLLKSNSNYALCVACHDGSGSKLDVLDGAKLAAYVSPRVPGQTGSGSLLGGGFEYVGGAAVTSKHIVNPSQSPTNQPWGYLTNTGITQTTTTLDKALNCSSCHDPHGSANYRILKTRIGTSTVFTVSVMAFYTNTTGLPANFFKDEGGPGLNTAQYPTIPSDKYTKDYYGSNGLTASGGYNPNGNLAATAGLTTTNGFALLCASCHSSYASASGSTLPSTNPWSITNYRHRTENPYNTWNNPRTGAPVVYNPETQPFNPSTGGTGGAGVLPALRLASTNNSSGYNTVMTCQTCHNAHGTTANMTGYAVDKRIDASGVLSETISPAQTSSNKSGLLVMDNRGVCEACHQW